VFTVQSLNTDQDIRVWETEMFAECNGSPWFHIDCPMTQTFVLSTSVHRDATVLNP
jgi:hypothetical protein